MTLNLNQQPTVDDLARLFAARRDSHDSHILWVCAEGNVHIEAMTPHTCEEQFEQHRPHMRTRLRVYRRGAGYVGKRAAADRAFIGNVLSTLTRSWQQHRHHAGVKVLDQYC